MSYPEIIVKNYNLTKKKNLCDYLKEPLRISTFFNGQRLEGHFVFISPSDYEIKMDYPISGLKGGSHTPYFAMFDQNKNIIQGRITEKCFMAGEAQLQGLYMQYFFKKNKVSSL